MNTMLARYRTHLFLICALSALIGWFGKDDFRSATPRDRALLPPLQTAAVPSTAIAFQKDGYAYTLTPRFNYDISGLVLHRLAYNQWFSLSRTDEVFTLDLCLMWGNNLASGAYLNPTLAVEQDVRFCVYRYQPGAGAPVLNGALSNNHMVVSDPAIQSVLDDISAGDQVRITGKLVDVQASALGATGQFESRQREWRTSTTRNDSGAGACEIIYVENVQILARGNLWQHLMYNAGLYGMLLVGVWSFMRFLRSQFFP